MSKGLFHNNIWSLLFREHVNDIYTFMCKIGCVAIPHSVYVYGTSTEEQIRVQRQYQYTSNGFTQFMIIDAQGRHFCMNNSLWYWKWDTIEDWNRLQKCHDHLVDIRYYGYRIPFLGLFPIIFDTKKKE